MLDKIYLLLLSFLEIKKVRLHFYISIFLLIFSIYLCFCIEYFYFAWKVFGVIFK